MGEEKKEVMREEEREGGRGEINGKQRSEVGRSLSVSM